MDSELELWFSSVGKVKNDFKKWENAELNTAETAYYIDVQIRVNKKLLEVTYN